MIAAMISPTTVKKSSDPNRPVADIVGERYLVELMGWLNEWSGEIIWQKTPPDWDLVSHSLILTPIDGRNRGSFGVLSIGLDLEREAFGISWGDGWEVAISACDPKCFDLIWHAMKRYTQED